MKPGPVFAAELLTTARRARYYALRMVYGLAILAVIWVNYAEMEREFEWSGRVITPGEMARLGRRLFLWFATVQVAAVMVLTPALVAGTVASEKQRKTLLYLLVSRMSSTEIVLGKLAARMLLLLTLLAIGLPLFFLIRLFGGLEWSEIAVVFAATLTLAFFLASLALACSTAATNPRWAIVAAYLGVFGLVLAPLVAFALVSSYSPYLDWLPETLALVNPLGDARQLLIKGPETLWPAQLITAQILWGSALLAWSIRKLRPLAAGREAPPNAGMLFRARRWKWQWRLFPRPRCGDDAMLWKERHTSKVGGWGKLLGILNNVFWVVLITICAWEWTLASITEILQYGYFNDFIRSGRDGYRDAILMFSPWLAGFWILGTAFTAAASITSEREGDSWLSLIATPLTGGEILRAKMLGVALRFRWPGLTLGLTWVLGVALGSISPFGLATVTVEMLVFLWFAAALGIRSSLFARTTSKSLAVTIGILLFLNGGYLLLNMPFAFRTPYVANAGIMPRLISDALIIDQRRPNFLQQYHYQNVPLAQDSSLAHLLESSSITAIVGVTIYATFALYLTLSCFYRFDEVADRPNRYSQPPDLRPLRHSPEALSSPRVQSYSGEKPVA